MITIDSNTFMIVVMGAAVVGFIFGLIAMSLRSGSPESAEKKKGFRDIAHLWRDEKRGSLAVQLGEKVYEVAGELNDEQREDLSQTLFDLGDWLGVPIGLVSADSKISRSPQPPEPAEPAEDLTPPLAPAQPEVSKPAAEIIEKRQTSSLQTSAERPRVNPMKGLRQMLESNITSVERESQVSIAAQVDEILQEGLKFTPYAQKGVRLMELPGKGMVVMVGMDQYGSVEEIPDPKIRAIIKAAVAEWERRMLS